MALVWLLDLDVGGAMQYLSTRPVHFDDRQYRGGMDSVVLRESIGQLGSLPDTRSAVVDLLPDIDPALLASYGHDLAAGRGTLTLWDTDEPEYRAEVHLRDGRVAAPDIGERDQAVSLTLSGEPYDDRTPFVPEEASVTQETWPQARQDAYGRRYPMPMGSPGDATEMYDGSPGGLWFTGLPGSPVPVVEVETATGLADTVLIAGEPVDATEVLLLYEGQGGYRFSSVLTVTTSADGLGRQVAIADISALTNDERGASAHYVAFVDDFATSAAVATFGIASSVRAGRIESVGQAILECVSRAGFAVDVPAWLAVANQLQAPVGWFIDDDQSALDALISLIEYLPVAMYSSAAGLAAVIIPTEATGNGAVKLVQGRNFFRAERFSAPRQPGETVTTVRTEYAIDRIRDEPARLFIRGPGTTQGLAVQRSDVYVRASQIDPQGPPVVETVRVPWAYSASTAQYVASWQSRKNAVSPRIVRGQVDAELARVLRLGQEVAVTIPEWYLTNEIGFITARDIADSPLWDVEISLLSGVASSVQETGDGADDTPPTNPTPPQ